MFCLNVRRKPAPGSVFEYILIVGHVMNISIISIVFLILCILVAKKLGRRPADPLEGGTLMYPIHWKVLMLGGSIISLWVLVRTIVRFVNGSETGPVYIGIGFFLLLFLAAFLFLLETSRTVVYTHSQVEFILYFRRSIFQWSEIEALQYVRAELKFFNRNNRAFSVPVNLPGFMHFLSFAEDHLQDHVKATYSLSLQNAREGSASAGRL